jgi:hypothetical protein
MKKRGRWLQKEEATQANIEMSVVRHIAIVIQNGDLCHDPVVHR